jgi:DNA-binding response OmpR family regulator
LKQLALLIIEGDSSVLRLFADFFTGNDCHVVAYGEGRGATRALLAEDLYDVILVSYKVPGTEGIELVKLIRELRHRKDTPVIMVTGSGNIDDEAFAVGVNEVLHKPLDLKRLLKIVRGLAQSNGENEQIA